MKPTKDGTGKDRKGHASLKDWLSNNSLSIVFFCLFAASLIGQSMAGHISHNATLNAHRRPAITFPRYLLSGDFLEGIFSNWQAAILQIGCLIIFGTKLRQKGAAHSRKPEGDAGQKTKEEEEKNQNKPDGPQASWLYCHSLSLSFALMFAAAFLAHIVFGTRAFNEINAMVGQAPVSPASYVKTGDFWFKTLQTWQAEILRHRGLPPAQHFLSRTGIGRVQTCPKFR